MTHAEQTPMLCSVGKAVCALGKGSAAITDGLSDRQIHWDGGEAPASALMDLDGYYRISRINLVTYYGDGRYYHFRVWVSADGSHYTLFGEKTDDTPATAEGTDLIAEAVTARYVKIEMLYNSANPSVHIAECSVYGLPDTEYVPATKTASVADPDDLAYRKSVKAGGGSRFAALAVDGNEDTYWIGDSIPRHLDVDLEKNYRLSKVCVATPNLFSFTYTVYGSLDGVHFDRLFDSTDAAEVPCGQKNTRSAYCFPEDARPLCRVLRVLITSSSKGAGGLALISGVHAYGDLDESRSIVPTRKTLEIPSHRDWLLQHYGVDTDALKDEKGFYRPEQTYTEADTVAALKGLVSRVLGKEYVPCFRFMIADLVPGRDAYRVEGEGDTVKITGRNGVSIAVGLNRYLKELCGVHVSQQKKQIRTLPAPDAMPLPGEPLTGKCDLPVRYAYNYCTLSYTMPFFGYEDWQRELDYLLLSGVNVILDTTATEALWVSYLQKLGYTTDEAKDYVCGYCYKAWWMMGNLEGYCGPVSDEWVLDTLELARHNQRYMTVMGAQPSLQTFVGAMPESFGSLAKAHLLEKGFEDVSAYMAPQGLWAGGFVRPNVLKTSYNGYSYLAKLFYDTQNEIYGQLSDYYCGDVCHEGGIVPADLSKPEMSAQILSDLMASDPQAVWMLQGWWSNPMKEVLDGFGSLREDHVIILDLASLAKPKWTDPKTWDGVEFGGTGWIYCNLDNYGGRTGMHGKLREMARLMTEAKAKGKHLKGIGITPEGTFGNPVVFDLFWEMAWKGEREPDVDAWVSAYVQRRYGLKDGEESPLYRAWELFEQTVYGADTYDGTTKNNVINENASLGEKYCSGGYYKIQYDRDLFEQGVKEFMKASHLLAESECYVYDAVDFLRMTLTIACDDYFDVLKKAFAAGNYAVFHTYKDAYLRCMELVTELCSYNGDERLGNWIGRAYDWCKDAKNHDSYDRFSLDMMEYNARILLTVWASSPITNYANRQYDGLMEDYFLRMWRELLEKADAALEKGEKIPAGLGGARCFTIGWDFALNGKTYGRETLNPLGGEGARGIEAIYEAVQNHMGNAASLKELCQALDAEIQEHSGEEEVSATISTNVEH